MKDVVDLLFEVEKTNKKEIYKICLGLKKDEKIISLILIFILTSCTTASRFGTGVDITFDPRTIGMQIDDTIMQKNLNARLALTEKNIF